MIFISIISFKESYEEDKGNFYVYLESHVISYLEKEQKAPAALSSSYLPATHFD